MTQRNKVILIIVTAVFVIAVGFLVWAQMTGRITIFGSETELTGVSCQDTDGGEVFNVKGIATDSEGRKGEDICINENAAVAEHFCQSNQVYVKSKVCPNGCGDGACITDPAKAVTKKGIKIYAGLYPKPDVAPWLVNKPWEILIDYAGKLSPNINGLDGTNQNGLRKTNNNDTSPAISKFHKEGNIVMGHVGSESQATFQAKTGADIIVFDEMKLRKVDKDGNDCRISGKICFDGTIFNEVKNSLKAINPNVKVGFVEAYTADTEAFFKEGATPDYVGLEQYDDANGNTPYPTYDSFTSALNRYDNFKKAKLQVWVNRLPEITEFMTKPIDSIILFDVDRMWLMNENSQRAADKKINWPTPFGLNDIENTIKNIYNNSQNTCEDGTPINSCSKSNSLYCQDKKLASDCTKCGCPVPDYVCHKVIKLCQPPKNSPPPIYIPSPEPTCNPNMIPKCPSYYCKNGKWICPTIVPTSSPTATSSPTYSPLPTSSPTPTPTISPTNLKATEKSQNTVKLTWDGMSKNLVSSFKVYRNPLLGSVDNPGIGNTVSFTVKDLNCDTNYNFSVTAIIGGNESIPSRISATTDACATSSPAPTPPIPTPSSSPTISPTATINPSPTSTASIGPTATPASSPGEEQTIIVSDMPYSSNVTVLLDGNKIGVSSLVSTGAGKSSAIIFIPGDTPQGEHTLTFIGDKNNEESSTTIDVQPKKWYENTTFRVVSILIVLMIAVFLTYYYVFKKGYLT